MPCETAILAKLIKKCAFEMNAHDTQELEKDRELGLDSLGRNTTNADGKRICEETARGMNAEPLGTIVYLLLAYAWNDALDWADKVA